MVLLLALGLAHADDEIETCDLSPLRAPPASLSVAWVSPTRKRAHNQSWLEVVPTSDLRKWIHSHHAGIARTLQGLGLRRSERAPRRSYKITIFDVDARALCRPLEPYPEVTTVVGIDTCPGGLGRATRNYGGCGTTTDLADDSPGLDLYRVQWRDAARNGFCVLSAQRFTAESRR